MAESRIEKFREYRRSIINNETDVTIKTPIETSLETNSTESKTLPSELESNLLGKIKFRKVATSVVYSVIAGSIVILLVVFGLILF